MENLTYELKCKRCGELKELAAPSSTRMFLEVMSIMRREGTTSDCAKCGKITVHDVVSCSPQASLRSEPELTQSQKDLIEKCNGK